MFRVLRTRHACREILCLWHQVRTDMLVSTLSLSIKILSVVMPYDIILCNVSLRKSTYQSYSLQTLLILNFIIIINVDFDIERLENIWF